MSNLYLTLIVTFLLIVIGIACLAAGWLITGRKSRYDKYREQIKKTTEEMEAPTRPVAPKFIDEQQDIIAEEDSNKESK